MAHSRPSRPASLMAALLLCCSLAGCGSPTTPSASVASATGSPAPPATDPVATAPARSPGASATTPAPPSPTFLGQPARAAGLTSVTIVAAGDIACDPAQNKGQPRDCDQAATADEIGQLRPTAVLTLGDNQYQRNTLAAYRAVFDPTWGRFRSILYPTIGNHEYETPGAAGYFAYFGFPPYYSYDLGAWHVISLDSECHFIGGCGPGSPQTRWLLADLTAHPTLCTLVTWHEPRFSSGEHGDASQMVTIWADLVAAHVDVVLTGHNHDYERFVPLDATGQPDPLGTTEFVVGTGGKNHYGFVEPPLTGEVVRNDQSFGVIDMTLGPTGYSWRFVPAAGYTFSDSGSASCH